MRLALGANCEGKERVKVKARRTQVSRIGSALVCVCRNAQFWELKLPEFMRFMLITVVMVTISTNGLTGCLVNPPPLSSENMPSRKKSGHEGRCDTAHRLLLATAVLNATIPVVWTGCHKPLIRARQENLSGFIPDGGSQAVDLRCRQTATFRHY